MLKAGALLYAMFLVIVTTIISSSFILINYYNNSAVVKALKKEQVLLDVNSGVQYGLAAYREIPLNKLTEVDLFNDGKNMVYLTKKRWGVLSLLHASASWSKRKFNKTALTGIDLNTPSPIALYLADQNKPLAICGNTRLVGDCYIPKNGVKRAYIEGKSFSGTQLIDGKKHQSSRNLPLINDELTSIKNSLSNATSNDSVMEWSYFFNMDTISNSFTNKTLVIHANNNISIAQKVIKGNIRISSLQDITISSSTYLENVLLEARNIHINQGTTLNLQAFATDNITIGKNCNLTYPSVLAILSQENKTKNITIEEECSINGAVILYQKNRNRKQKSILSIAKNTSITGQVYASDILELKGDVNGSVFCNTLMLKTSSSTYENHLLDASINRKKLPKDFIGVELTAGNQPQKIIKWVY